MMIRYMVSISIAMFLLLLSSNAIAQHEVTGVVTDAATGETLPGVNILIEGTDQGTTTDVDGFYSLNVPSPTATLIFSYIGYETLEVAIDNRNEVAVNLSPSTIMFGEELVVVGYGTLRRQDITGSVVQLDERFLEINRGGLTSVDGLLRGAAPGVQVVQTSGEPGGGFAIDIRGVGSITAGSGPLYVIDGLPINNSNIVTGTGTQLVQNQSPRDPLSSLNPEDIESIEILKDASATAIYGSRGANGVILITTKRGQSGSLEVNYNAHAGIQNVHNRLDLLSPEEYMREINSIIDSNNRGEWLPEERVTEIQNGGTDWQDVIYRDNALFQKHNLSFSWGTENTTIFTSLNLTNQDGVLDESSYDRYGVRFNLRHTSNYFNFGVNSSMSYIQDNLVPYGFDVNLRGGVVNSARQFDPTLSLRDDNSNLSLSPFDVLDNPYAIKNGNHMQSDRYRYQGTVYGEYNLTPQLTVRLNAGADVGQEDRRIYQDRQTIIGRNQSGVATQYHGTQSNYLIEGRLNYQAMLAENHRVNFVAGSEFQRFINNNSNQQAFGFPTDATLGFNFGLASPDSYVINSGSVTNSLLSYIGRLNYSFRDTYLFTGSFRIDGSSRFGEENRFGYFPSFSVGWMLNNEEFFPLKETFNQFKLRGSWGKTGNDRIGNFQYMLTFGSGGPNYVLNDQLVETLQPARIANPDLKWETTEQIDIGLDFSMFNDRIYGSFDWYEKRTYDMLLNLPIPTSTGFSTQQVNIGEMKNSGVEFSLTSRNISTGNFLWSTSVNLTTLKNEVLDLGPLDRIIATTNGAQAIIEPGKSLRSFFGYEVLGVWQEDEASEAASFGFEPGDWKYRDINGDGRITGEDRIDLGNSFPDFSWSLTNTLNYKSFSLNFSIQAVHGVKMFNRNLEESYSSQFSRRMNKFADPFINRWTSVNPTNDHYSYLNPGIHTAYSQNSKTVVDASYIKLQSVRLSYDIPVRIIDGTIRNAQIYITGQNLFTISDYDYGYDPALNPAGRANFRVDWNGYPSATSFLAGIDITF